MSETIHIKELADKISAEIFEIFGWKLKKPTDYKWTCVEQEKHGKKKTLVHPTDAVFFYHDPYFAQTVYVNTDLKSYSKSSTEAYNLQDDMISLQNTVECAMKSPSFQKFYIYDKKQWTVDGLLFVYNHDAEYDRDFDRKIEKIKKKNRIPGPQRLFVLGPQRIAKLYSISRDIDSRIQKITRAGLFDISGFFAPELDVTKVKGKQIGAATLDMLVGPWLIHQIRTNGGTSSSQIYYLDDNPEKDDFKYLIDALLDFELLGDTFQIELCISDSTEETATAFLQARTEYAAENHGITEDALTVFEKRLERITYASVAYVKPPFFELELAIR